MRLIAKLTGLLAMPLLGVIIGGLIAGNRPLWGWGIVLFVLDCIVGMSAQYFADREDRRIIEYMKMREENSDENFFSKRETEEENAEASYEFSDEKKQRLVDIMRKNGLMENMQSMKRKGMVDRFDDHYTRLKALPEGGRAICFIGDDPSAELLFEVCASMTYAPRRHDFFEAIAVLAVEIEGAPAIWYALKPRGGGIQYASIFLVRSKPDKIRLFSVEPSAHTLFLCEFADGSHINYGDVRSADFRDRIGEILRSENK